MCGIVAYIGHREAEPILLDGMSRIEYRGYDSAGIATLEKKPQGHYTTELRRAAGKLERLRAIVQQEPCKGQIGIGHTRWATHGKPTENNAHPHSHKGFTLVHNGIIENYRELKERLIEHGHSFASETDSEVLLHLIVHHRQHHANTFGAIAAALEQVKGSFAFALIDEATPEQLFCAQQARPMVIGYGNGENFLAADFPALLPYTQEFSILQEGDIAILTAQTITVYDHLGSVQERPRKTLHWSYATAEKEGHKHFMLKEIFEQPSTLSDTLRGRIDQKNAVPFLEGINCDALLGVKRIAIIACGTSYHAAMLGKYLIESFARIPVDVDIASEYRYRQPVIDDSSLVIGISQSGETADTLAALADAFAQGAKVMAICNVLDSAIARLCDKSIGTFYTHAGPEISVASTKSFMAQMLAMHLIALHFAQQKFLISSEDMQSKLTELASLSRHVEHWCKENNEAVRTIAKKYMHAQDMLFLGRGLLYPIALEGALKMKELSYMHAEGYAAGEMKHGPIALIDDKMPVVVLALLGHAYEKILSNLEEARARGAQIIAVLQEGDKSLDSICEDRILIPELPPLLAPFMATLPMQLLAYHVADLRGNDVDQPRNLAKSVTVE